MKKKIQSLVERLEVTEIDSIYGCDPLFSICSDQDLMSLSFEGMNPFLDWLTWQRTDICLIRKNFYAYERAAALVQAISPGWLSDPCADPYSTEFAVCDFTLEDFARLRRRGPVRDITKTHIRYCEVQPRYRLDGSPINDDMEYDIRIATEVLLQDLKRMIIDGDDTTAGQFDGLETLITSGYVNSDSVACPMMDSIIIDWNESPVDDSATATWNSAAIADDTHLIDVLHAVYRRIRARIRMAPALNVQGLRPSDMILLLPDSAIPCILDAFTCWSVCDDESVTKDSFEARRFRTELAGGAFGAGRIFLDGFEIPLMPYDWGLITGSGVFDMYLLTGSIGGVRIMQGQYNDMNTVAGKSDNRYSLDGGKLLTWANKDQTCEEQIVEIQPRLLCWAPWAQARIIDVECDGPGGFVSVDPWNSYHPSSSGGGGLS